MQKRSLKFVLLATTLMSGATWAQQPVEGADSVVGGEALSDADDGGAAIVVTGSRIKQRNLESVSPILQVGQEDFKVRGVLRTEDMLNSLPQVQAAQGGQTSLRGITGTAQVDLRGLGPSRTLVLVNGRRLPYGSPKSVPADLNQIPSALIRNVEVLTGGASAVYGSDAIAGVVNFTLIDDFQGIRLNANLSGFQHNNRGKLFPRITAPFEAANPGEYAVPRGSTWDGFGQEYSIVAGSNFDDKRGNVTVYASYRKINEIKQDRRDYSTCKLGPAAGGTDFTCNPSPVDVTTSFVNSGAAGLPGEFRVLNDTFAPRNALVDRFNDQQDAQFQRPDTRYAFGALAHYEINDHFKPFLEMSFTQTRTAADYSAGAVQRNGIDQNSGGINCDNPFLSAQQQNYLCTSRGLSTASNYDPVTGAYIGPASVATGVVLNRRTPETGNRHDAYRLTSYRLLGGLKGDLFGPFDYEFAGSYANVSLNRVQTGLPSQARAAVALNAVTDRRVGSRTFGQPVCAVNADGTTANDVPTCSPINFFSNNPISQAAADYIYAEAIANGDSAQTNLVFSVSGDLGAYGIQSPFAEHGVGIALGGEYRKNTLDLAADLEFQQQQEDFPVAGQTSVKEWFVEANLPLVEERPFFHELSFEGAYRYSKYKGSVSTDTYKLGVNWSPIRDIRFRGSYQRAVRAPNAIELFSAQLRTQALQIPLNPNGRFDPCAGPTPFASFEQCARTGVTASQYGNIADNNFFGVVQGGNPNLEPEVADTLALGAVLQPRFASGLTISVDYFNIKVDKLLGTVNPTLALSGCLQTGNPFFCSLIHRGQGGTLHATNDAFFSRINLNTGSLETSGIDVAANYPLDLDRIFSGNPGRLTFNLAGTWLKEFVTKPLPTSTAAQTYDCAGYYALICGAPRPKWRHTFRSTWESPWDLNLTLTWRYISGVDISRASDQPALRGTFAEVDRHLNSRSYFDLAASWKAKDNLTLRAGVNNILDKDPPLSSQVAGVDGGNGNTYSQYYDVLGRYLFFSATIDF